jgi:hypothetical protein
MERHLLNNIKNAKWLIGSLAAGTLLLQYGIYRPGLMHLEVFGLDGNGGKMLINKIATYEGFDEAVWFSTKAMTNILSFARVKKEYRITYNGDYFIIHRKAKGFPDMVFKPHPSGLHIHDPYDKRGLASFCFLETVDESKAMFTNKQIISADKARNLHAGLAFLSMQDYKWALQANLLRDCPVTVQDLSVALKI